MIALDERCGECGGTGCFSAPEWLDHWKEVAGLAFEDGLTFQEATRLIQDREPETPEEVPCGVCHGAQRVPTEAGEAVLAFLARQGIVPRERRP